MIILDSLDDRDISRVKGVYLRKPEDGCEFVTEDFGIHRGQR
jgi:hypothetical protein